MNGYLRQSTASQSRLIGPFIDDTDFKTPKTGLTIANTDIKLRANGTTLSNKNSGGGTHQVNGEYSVTWDATDTANVGELAFSVVVASALSVFGTYVVLEEAVYDALFAASAPGYLQPTVAGRTLDVSAGGEAGLDWANIGSPTTAENLSGTTIATSQVVASVTGAVGSVTGAVGSVAGNVGGNVTGSVGSVAGNVGGNVTGSVGSVVGNLGGNVNGNVVGSVGSVVGNVGGNVTGSVGSVVGNVGGSLVGNVEGDVQGNLVGDVQGNVDGSVGSLAAQAKTDVKAQVVAGLSTDNYAEPTGVPAATTNLAAKIGRVYQSLRNGLTVTATEKTFQDDNTSNLWKKPLSDDGTTYTEGEGIAP